MAESRFVYHARTSKVRTDIEFIEKQVQELLKEMKQAHKQKNIATRAFFEKNYNVKKLKLNKVFLYLLINRISLQTQKIHNISTLKDARNNVSQILTFWENDLGKDFLPLYEDDYAIHRYSDNLQVAEHFKSLGFAMDTINNSYTEVWKKITFMRLQVRFLTCFCNALNFKVLIKEIENLGSTYAQHQNILAVVKNNFDRCIDNYWKNYMSVSKSDISVYEMNVALSLIDFIKRFSSILFNRQDHENYKKRYRVWKNYIDKQNDEAKE